MYVTPEYYNTDYGGTLISQDKLVRNLAKAEREINHLCFSRINGKGFENLSSYQQNLVKEAVCLQADYDVQYGPYLNSPLRNYSAGSTKVEMADVSYGGISTTQEIVNLLEDTGLRCLQL